MIDMHISIAFKIMLNQVSPLQKKMIFQNRNQTKNVISSLIIVKYGKEGDLRPITGNKAYSSFSSFIHPYNCSAPFYRFPMIFPQSVEKNTTKTTGGLK
jgi:hypothetical protein